jgi:long-chain acyl-CoA synthetase
MGWWAHPAALTRFVRDVLQAEMAQLRPGGWALPAAGWHAQLHWVHDLGADSLELMSLATALADAVGLRSAQAADALYADLSVGAWQSVAGQSLNASGAALRFRTSGSTGAPKTCSHSLDILVQEMQTMARVVGPVKRIVSAVRCHHIYGFLFTVLLPQVMGRPDMPLLDLQGMAPLALGERLQAGDLVIGFPDWWRMVARAQTEFAPGVVGVTSTAPCPDEVCQSLLDGGLSRLLHIYGSSETAGVGWRDWPAPHYNLHPFWQRLPAQPQSLVRQLPNGETLGVQLQDEITWLDEHRFMPGARVDGAVQIGGVNVHLAQVRRVLMTHPGVVDAVVRVHDFGGQPRLKAFLVSRDGEQSDSLAGEVQRWASSRLAPAARPMHYRVGQALPVNAQGKPCDWALELALSDI